MAQMNQKQRDYFVDRIKTLTKTRINQIKATHAAEIQALADQKYKEFLDGIGVLEDMEALKTAQDIQQEVNQRMIGVVQGLRELYPDAESHAYYNECNYYEKHNAFLMSCCRVIAKDEFYKTKAGQELKELEKTQDTAIDTVMLDGCKVQELTAKLNNILGNSGLKLIGTA